MLDACNLYTLKQHLTGIIKYNPYSLRGLSLNHAKKKLYMNLIQKAVVSGLKIIKKKRLTQSVKLFCGQTNPNFKFFQKTWTKHPLG